MTRPLIVKCPSLRAVVRLAAWVTVCLVWGYGLQARASDSEPPVGIYCQSVTTGSHFAAQLYALDGQYTSANQYLLTFGPGGATISTPAGVVIAAVAYPPAIQTDLDGQTTYTYPQAQDATVFQVQGIAATQMRIATGSSLGAEPYGVTSCQLGWSAEAVPGAVFAIATQAEVVAAEPVLTDVAGTANGMIPATVGVPFQYAITATNAPNAYGVLGMAALGSPLPAGLSLDPTTGIISGTPAAGTAGTYPLVFQAANAVGIGTEPIELTIAPSPTAPVVTSPLSASGSVGAAFTYQIEASQLPTTFASTPLNQGDFLPAGLSFDPTTGTVSGTPTQPGDVQLLISASTGSGTGTALLAITIAPAPGTPVITGPLSATAVTGMPCSLTLSASGSPSSYGLDQYPPPPGSPLGITLLPLGITFDATAGTFSGAAQISGVSTYQVYATNAAGSGLMSPLTLVLTAGPGAPVVGIAVNGVPAPRSASATVGQMLSGLSIIASNQPTSYGASGLPPGLTLDHASGTISGTPTQTGSFQVVCSANNADGSGACLLSLFVSATVSSTAAPVITSSLTAAATVGMPFRYQASASPAAQSYAATFLPLGLTMNASSGVISGTPLTAGTVLVAIQASSSSQGEESTPALLSISISASGGGSGGVSAGSGTTGTAGSVNASGGHGCGLGAAAVLLGCLAMMRHRTRSSACRQM